ncbi:MAG: AraD1 family protein [Geminicoccaceae bacterium]
MRLAQFRGADGERAVSADAGQGHRRVDRWRTVYELAGAAITRGLGLGAMVAKELTDEPVDLAALEEAGRLLPPLDHPTDPAHMLVTGTGLSHLGSAEGRDKMHRDLADAATLTDSMRMFKLGLEGGKPGAGREGAQPEWFFKGDGAVVAAPGKPLESPSFALDGGEEPEIVGLYLIGPDGQPWRVGFALGNEFSDHVTEKQNYLYLAHSKLRACSIGPELRLGELPADLRGTSRIRRDAQVVWEKPFLSGEANMCHAIENLERHHFKYPAFRRPGDVHAHFFGTSTLSFSDGFKTQPGDVFEIEMAEFGRPLRNALAVAETPGVAPRAL